MVEASGRGNLTAGFLASIGRRRPEETTIGVDTTADYSGIRLPLWIPFALIAIPSWLLERADRRTIHRAKNGLCLHCGYPLSSAHVRSY